MTPSAEKDVTDADAIAYLDLVDPHGTRSLSSILWAREQVAAGCDRSDPPARPDGKCPECGRTRVTSPAEKGQADA